MCARTGWTWDYVWELGVDRIECLEEHWKVEPPVDLLVAAFLGFKPKKASPVDPGNLVPTANGLPPGVTEGKTPIPPPPKSRLTDQNVAFLDGLFNRGKAS